jgi:3-hydroxybutyryl-CoA dehydratase
VKNVSISLAWNDLHEDMNVEIPFCVSAEDMRQFAKLSGDENPLHYDSDFAQKKGFKGPVVYGALIIAQVSRLIGMHLPGRNGMLVGLKMKFSVPLMVNEKAILKAHLDTKSTAARLVSIRLRVESNDRLIATGQADVVVREVGR